MQLNKNEHGQTLFANFNEDISQAIDINFILEPKRGNEVKKSSNQECVSIGRVNAERANNTYLANQYLKYTIEEGVLNQSGQWRIKGEVKMKSPTSNESYVISTDYEYVTVLE